MCAIIRPDWAERQEAVEHPSRILNDPSHALEPLEKVVGYYLSWLSGAPTQQAR